MAAPDDHAAPGGSRRPGHIRTRLILWMLVAVGGTALLLGLPLAVVARQWLFTQELSDLREQARIVDAVLDERPTAELGTSVAVVAMAIDARLTVLDVDGRVIRDSLGVAPGTQFQDAAVDTARTGRSAGSFVDGTLVSAIAGDIGDAGVIIRLARPGDAVVARAGTVVLAIAALTLAALTGGAALASWRARQLAEPLEALATSAASLGRGDFGQRAPRSGVVEIDRIAGALDTTADRLRDALQRSASFTADASHQLRTPLTALRLDIEALDVEMAKGDGTHASGEPHPLLEAASTEIDRLEATIAELLELADAAAVRQAVDLRALVLERLDAWRTLADSAGRAVRVTREPVPAVRVRPGAVGQALQVLLDNALVHGRGDVTVWLQTARRGQRSWVRLCVGDEGPGVTQDALQSSAGRGLSLARSLVESEGGRLVVDSEHSNRVCLLLPCDEGVDTSPELGGGSAPAADAPPDMPNGPR